MKVIRPIAFTEDNVVSINTTEAYSLWSDATTYSDGNIVYFGNFLYESLVGSNLDNQPDISETQWLKIGPRNAWACFDGTVSTRSTVPTGPLEIVVSVPVASRSLALLNIDNAASIQVMMHDMTPMTPLEVYNETYLLDSSVVTDWYEYFFSEFNLRTDLVINDLPPYLNSEITVILNSDGAVGLGVFLLGNDFTVGDTQAGLNYGIRDYSIKDTDTFGETVFVERNFSKRMSSNVFVKNPRLNDISRVLTSLRATPTVFIGSEAFDLSQTIIYGFLKDWNVELTYPANSIISIDIEGLI